MRSIDRIVTALERFFEYSFMSMMYDLHEKSAYKQKRADEYLQNSLYNYKSKKTA